MGIDEMKQYGLESMEDGEIDSFLAGQSVGVLGLNDTEVPYTVPMGYSYDGDSLYFTFVAGATSRKVDRSERYDKARFLVYDADDMFDWESVLLRGEISEIHESDWDDYGDVLDSAWQQSIFRKDDEINLRIFRFDITEREGYRYAGSPPGYE